MKIFHCLRNYYPGQFGGTEIYVAALCHELQAMGLEVAIVKPSFNREPVNYTYKGVEVFEYLEESEPAALLQVGLMPPKGLTNFLHLLNDKKPDAIHFHETAGSTGITIFHLQEAAKMGFLLFTTFHLPGNICMRDSFLFKGKYPCNGVINEYKCSVCLLHKRGLKFGASEIFSFIGEHLNKRIATYRLGKLFNYPLYVRKHKANLKKVEESCQRVFVLSNWYKNLLISNGFEEDKIIVLDHSTQASIPLEAQKKYSLTENSIIRFVYLGRFAEIKGLHIVLQALSELKAQNWQLDIYGSVTDQDYYQYCKQLSKNVSSITWKGHLLHNEIISTIAKYDALLFPSIAQETMGLVIQEAIAARVPVIGSNIWSVEEKIKHFKTGIVFNRGSVQHLRLMLSKLLENPSILTELASNITETKHSKSSGIKIVDTYLKFIEY
jgi:glycosyltransferase involved in cell wall biosynthesis